VRRRAGTARKGNHGGRGLPLQEGAQCKNLFGSPPSSARIAPSAALTRAADDTRSSPGQGARFHRGQCRADASRGARGTPPGRLQPAGGPPATTSRTPSSSGEAAQRLSPGHEVQTARPSSSMAWCVGCLDRPSESTKDLLQPGSSSGAGRRALKPVLDRNLRPHKKYRATTSHICIWLMNRRREIVVRGSSMGVSGFQSQELTGSPNAEFGAWRAGP
jgi:hypothetical protein